MTEPAKETAVARERNEMATRTTAGRVTRQAPKHWRAHLVLLAGVVVMIYPLVWLVGASFKPENQIFSTMNPFPLAFTIANYVSGWTATGNSFTVYLANSLTVSLCTVVANVASCSVAAYAFARLDFAFRKFWFAVMLGTMMLPFQATLIPQYTIFYQLNWINTYLPLVVPYLLAYDTFFIFLMVQFIRGIPRELDEAAMMDGCSPWKIYWKIIMPLSRPVLATAAIFSFIWTWDDFFAPLIYLNDMGSYTVQLGLRNFVDSTGKSDWSALFAMSILTLLPVFVFFLFFQRLLIEGVATTGLKR